MLAQAQECAWQCAVAGAPCVPSPPHPRADPCPRSLQEQSRRKAGSWCCLPLYRVIGRLAIRLVSRPIRNVPLFLPQSNPAHSSPRPGSPTSKRSSVTSVQPHSTERASTISKPTSPCPILALYIDVTPCQLWRRAATTDRRRGRSKTRLQHC